MLAVVVAAISSIVDVFLQSCLFGNCFVDVPRMGAVWSNASMARTSTDFVVAVAPHEDPCFVTARISLDASAVAKK
jgi:hypothetical protein